MSLFAIMTVKDEEDILEVNLRYHHAMGIDRFLILEDVSRDGTRGLLERLSRELPIAWSPNGRGLDQGEGLTALARDAAREGADWVVPIDADEFWWSPGGRLGEALSRARGGGLRVDMVTFVQRRNQRRRSGHALLTMTRRAPWHRSPRGRGRTLVGEGRIAYVEIWPVPKLAMRPTPEITIGTGGHDANLQGEIRECGDLRILHAPLRAREILDRKAEWAARREWDGVPVNVSWHARRWARAAARAGLELEWAANSYADEGLDVYGERHPVIVDRRLADAIAPFVDRGVLDERAGDGNGTAHEGGGA